MKSKKGVVEVQLNWIFVLIAGAIILLFFAGIVIRQKAVSETKISLNVLNKLKSTVSKTGVAAGTTTLLDIPETEILWDCTTKELRIEGAPSVDIGTQIFFAPDVLKGRRLLLWTQEWSTPFYVTNFLYATPPQIRYLLVYEDNDAKQEAERINRTLPEEMNIEIVSKNEFEYLEDKNNYRVKVILLGFENPDLNIDNLLPTQIPKETINIIQLDPRDIDGFNLYFFKGDTFTKEKTKYISKEDPSYYAAIFADTKENYDCMMKSAFKRLDKIKEIYAERVEELKATTWEDCQIRYYSLVPEDITDIRHHPIKGLGLHCSERFPDCKIDSISNFMDMIYNTNEALIRKSCPLIY